MKIQILISKNSWANKYKKDIKKKLKSFFKKYFFLNNHKKLKKNMRFVFYLVILISLKKIFKIFKT